MQGRAGHNARLATALLWLVWPSTSLPYCITLSHHLPSPSLPPPSLSLTFKQSISFAAFLASRMSGGDPFWKQEQEQEQQQQQQQEKQQQQQLLPLVPRRRLFVVRPPYTTQQRHATLDTRSSHSTGLDPVGLSFGRPEKRLQRLPRLRTGGEADGAVAERNAICDVFRCAASSALAFFFPYCYACLICRRPEILAKGAARRLSAHFTFDEVWWAP